MWHVGLLSLVYVASGPLSCWNVHWQESRSPSPMLRSFWQAWHGSGVNKVRKILSGRDLGRSLVTSRASSIDTVSRARHFKVRQFAIFAALFFMRASLCLSPRSCKHIVSQLVGNKHYPQEKQDKTEATQSWCTAASNFDNLMSELVQQLWATLLETTENWELGERGHIPTWGQLHLRSPWMHCNNCIQQIQVPEFYIGILGPVWKATGRMRGKNWKLSGWSWTRIWFLWNSTACLSKRHTCPKSALSIRMENKWSVQTIWMNGSWYRFTLMELAASVLAVMSNN